MKCELQTQKAKATFFQINFLPWRVWNQISWSTCFDWQVHSHQARLWKSGQ